MCYMTEQLAKCQIIWTQAQVKLKCDGLAKLQVASHYYYFFNNLFQLYYVSQLIPQNETYPLKLEFLTLYSQKNDKRDMALIERK